MICLNDTEFVGMKEAAATADVSQMTISRFSRAGTIDTRMNARGVKRYNLKSVCESFGIDYVEQDEIVQDRKISCYCRTSSKGQSESLKEQIKRVKTKASTMFKVDQDDLLVFQECTSSFKSRPQLNNLIDAILKDQISVVVIETMNRLSRMEAELELLKMLLERHNVELIELEPKLVDITDENEWIQNLVDYIQVLANRQSSMVQANRSRVDLEESTLKRIAKLYDGGMSFKAVYDVLESEGVKGTKGQKISHNIVSDRFKAYQKKQRRIEIVKTGDITKKDDSIDKFIKSQMIQGDGFRVRTGEVYLVWERWSLKRNIQPGTKKSFTSKVLLKGYTTSKIKGYPSFKSLKLK